MSATRRGIVQTTLGAVAAWATSAGARGWSAPPIARDRARHRLSQVERWGCQYQNMDVGALAASDLDLLVLEPVLDGTTGKELSHADVGRMKAKPNGERRLVLAYLSVGAAESWRPYFSQEWTSKPPAWLGSGDPVWPGSHRVRYWQPEWHDIVRRHLARIVGCGFDGVFLDRVDAFMDWRGERPTGQDDMIDLVQNVASDARNRAAGFLIVGQNAEPLLATARYVAAIDAVSKESLFTGLAGAGEANSTDDIAWSLPALLEAKRQGLTILTIEYDAPSPHVEAAKARHRSLGFKLFVGRRLLDRLPDS